MSHKLLLAVLLPLIALPAVAADLSIGVVPFRDSTGQPEAVPRVMAEVYERLERRGVTLVGNGRIEEFLREHRIRARSELSMQEVEELSALLGVRYLLVGTIDTWKVNGGPEVGLTARILEGKECRVAWAGSVSLHAVEAPGVLALGRPATLEQATRKAVRQLFADLAVHRDDGTLRAARRGRKPSRSWLADRPVAFRSARLDSGSRLRVALLPLLNRTQDQNAPVVVGDRLVAWLLGSPRVEVVNPGEVRRALIELDIQPLYGLDRRQLERLGSALHVDAVLDGTVLRFEDGDSPVPRIDLFAQLRDARTGEVLWSATTARNGEQTRTFYDLGRIRGMDRLADAAVSDLLSTWLR